MPPPPPRAASDHACYCGQTFTTLAKLSRHVRTDHLDASPAQLASMAFVRCDADGCNAPYCLAPKPGSSYSTSSWYQHQQQYRNRTDLGTSESSVAEHRALHAHHGTVADAYRAAAAQCALLAPPGSLGAALRSGAGLGGNATGPREADVACAAANAAAAADFIAAAGEALPPNTSTVPASDYNLLALATFDMDRLKRVRLLRQSEPSNPALAAAVAQPAVWAWRQRTTNSTANPAKAHAALMMRYLSHAVIHCRPVNESARSADDMVTLARNVASSPPPRGASLPWWKS